MLGSYQKVLQLPQTILVTITNAFCIFLPDDPITSTRSGKTIRPSAEELRFELGTDPKKCRDALQKKRAKATAEFLRRMEPLGFTITADSYLAWDGNCYFSGLYFFMRQWGIADGWTVMSLREAVFKYIRDLPEDAPDNDFYSSYLNDNDKGEETLRRSLFEEDCKFLGTHSCYKLEHSTIGEMTALGICRNFNVSIKMYNPDRDYEPEVIGNPNAPHQMVLGYLDVAGCQHVQALVPCGEISVSHS